MKRYRKTAIIELIEVLDNGDYLVQNADHPSDRWVIPKLTFESTYEEVKP